MLCNMQIELFFMYKCSCYWKTLYFLVHKKRGRNNLVNCFYIVIIMCSVPTLEKR